MLTPFDQSELLSLLFKAEGVDFLLFIFCLFLFLIYFFSVSSERYIFQKEDMRLALLFKTDGPWNAKLIKTELFLFLRGTAWAGHEECFSNLVYLEKFMWTAVIWVNVLRYACFRWFSLVWQTADGNSFFFSFWKSAAIAKVWLMQLHHFISTSPLSLPYVWGPLWLLLLCHITIRIAAFCRQ